LYHHERRIDNHFQKWLDGVLQGEVMAVLENRFHFYPKGRDMMPSANFSGRLPTGAALAGTAFATLLLVGSAGCDDDVQPNQGGSGGSLGGASGTGGGSGGRGGSSTGTGGTAGMAAVTDTDVVVARFNSDGTLDTTFGEDGVARIDFKAPAGDIRAALWGMAKDGDDRLLLFGSRKGEGTRIDTDRVVVRLTADGSLDTSFGDAEATGGMGGAGAGGAGGAPAPARKGWHTLNIGNANDNPRNGIVQPDGKIVASGYFAQATGVGAQTANRVTLLRLNPDGTPDTMFGSRGISTANPFVPAAATTEWGMAEAYGVTYQPSTQSYVTAGYGRLAPSGQVNVVAFRFGPTGALDTTWATAGILEKDIAGGNDRGRNVLTLPDNRILIVGSTTPTPNAVDAMVMVLGANGALDTTFDSDGFKFWDFGRAVDEAFYGVAVSPNQMMAAATGHRTGGEGMNDDALVYFLPLTAGATDTAVALPLSETENDRLWAVTFGADNKAYAGGYISRGGDRRMVAVRLSENGTLDTTFATATAGIAEVNASVGGTPEEVEEARGIVVQASGKIVVAGVARHK
jgi:uncharacterized delta-60 repeat protein